LLQVSTTQGLFLQVSRSRNSSDDASAVPAFLIRNISVYQCVSGSRRCQLSAACSWFALYPCNTVRSQTIRGPSRSTGCFFP